MGRVAVRALVALFAGCAVPCSWAQFHSLETDDLRLVYFHPVHSYLVPHAARWVCLMVSTRCPPSSSVVIWSIG